MQYLPSDIVPHCSVAATRHGQMAYLRLDDPIGKALRVYGEWAESEIDLLLSLVDPMDTVLDVGANIGTHSLAFAKHLAPGGKLHAFEPQTTLFHLLEANLAQNGHTNVSCHAAAVGSVAGKSAIPHTQVSQPFNSGRLGAIDDFENGDPAVFEVRRMAIDDLNLDRCDLIKVDVEGGERAVLEGASETIDRFKPVLYLECNTFENGRTLLHMLRELGYTVFYSTTPAFNQENFNQVTDNFFGCAHESSLLGIHPENRDKWTRIIDTEIPVVDSDADLLDFFDRTPRYGDDMDRPSMESSSQGTPLPTARPPGVLRHPVRVIVPVYNAPDYVRRLIASLETAIPDPLPGLTFHFADDCSPDAEIGRIFESAFFGRPDVGRERRPVNLGFVGNVNAAIADAPDGADLVLLNSDTEVLDEIFSVLQAEAYSDAQIASVTPLTNNGTIASLFHFPGGSGLPKALSATMLSRAVRNLDLPMSPVRIPTAVGFCMYIKREAIAEIGVLDDAFGRGYGEEVDWCRRAVAKGWTHVLTCKAFVLHEGTRSFNENFKADSLRTNSEILLARYPDYDHLVARYIHLNPLKFDRIAIILEALQMASAKPVYLFTLHNHPDSPHGGGTEKHVRGLQHMLDSRGHVVLELYPAGSHHLGLRISSTGQLILEQRFHVRALGGLMAILERHVDCLHVHHTLHWPQEALRALVSSRIPRKAVTAHDYYLICPTINLLRSPLGTSYCGVERDPVACNTCLNRIPGYERTQMSAYRRETLALLSEFDTILFPSESLRDNFERAFGLSWKTLSPRAQVLHHDLEYVWNVASPTDARHQVSDRYAVIIGAIGLHKGSTLVLEALPKLKALGYRVEILGELHPRPAEVLADTMVTPYRSPAELKALLDARNPSLTVFPAIWAETFCYAFYEGMILAEGAVPVVGPHGNPAQITTTEGIGVTMQAATADALVEACEEATRDHARLLARKRDYLKKLARARTPYLEGYLTVVPGTVRTHGVPAATDLQVAVDTRMLSLLDHTLANLDIANRDLEHLRQIHGGTSVKLAIKLQGKLQGYPRLKSTMGRTVRLAWAAYKRMRNWADR